MKRIITALLVFVMIAGLLVGCGGGNEEDPSTAPSTAPSAAPSYEGPVEPIDDDEIGAIDLPLTNDGHTFTMWQPNWASFEDFSTYDDNVFFQWLEEQTGVHIEWIHPAMGSLSESFQTMVLSQDYPDFIAWMKMLYSGGMDKAINDGVALRLNELVDEKMPHYKAAVYASEDIFTQCITDSGNLRAVHRISDVAQGATGGPGVRADWLEKAGYTVADLETMDGLEKVLTTFVDYTYENKGPLFPGSNGFFQDGGINGSYNVSGTNNSSGILNKDGTAVYSALEPGMKPYVAKMADWYAKGLVNRDYVASGSMGEVKEDVWANSEAGVGEFTYVNDKLFAAAAANSSLIPSPDFRLAAFTTPKVNASDSWANDIHVRIQNDIVQSGNSTVITTNCSDIDLACRWWDYLWTEEGKHASNWGPYEGEYGEEGTTYYVDETDANQDGHVEAYQPFLLDKYGSIFNVQMKYAWHMGSAYNIWSREWSVLEPYQIEYTRIWETADSSYWWPQAVTLTADEGASASGILANCNTAVNERVAAVITGEKSVDTYESELVPMLKSMNIDDAIACYQAALGRYLDRTQYLNK